MTMQSMITTAQEVKLVAEGQTDKLESTLEKFLNDLMKKHGDGEVSVGYYNAFLGCMDLEGLDKKTYDNIVAAHAKVLRNMCRKKRGEVVLTPAQMGKTFGHALAASNHGEGKIAGFRKSVKASTNVGIVTPWLSPEDMHDAVLAMCSWSVPSNANVLDAGFLLFCGDKFDPVSGLLKDGVDVDAEFGVTPKEFGPVCSLLIERLLKSLGTPDTMRFLENVFNDMIAGLKLDVAIKTVVEYAKTRKVKIDIADKAQLVACLTSFKDPPDASFGMKIPSNATVDFGMEFLFPFLPLLSRTWVTRIMAETKMERIGFLDNLSLYRGYYRCAGGNKFRLLPTANATYIACVDVQMSEQVAQTSQSKSVMACYHWEASDAKSDQKVRFTLDDVLRRNVFRSDIQYVLAPRHVDVVALPNKVSMVKMSDDVSSRVVPAWVKPGALFILVMGDKSEVMWGTPIPQAEAEGIMARSEFVAGQEYDTSRVGYRLCQFIGKDSVGVTKAVKAAGGSYSMHRIGNLK